ncbi:MAG: DUF5615 family PIN-like protein [Thermocrispum sp.]
MKLLLDEMMQRTVAEQLRRRGRDVVAVTERPDLRGLPDREVFVRAQAEGRAVVTYNHSDFLPVAAEHQPSGRSHHGLVLVSPKRFPQGASTGKLLNAIDRVVTAGPPYDGFIHWLK